MNEYDLILVKCAVKEGIERIIGRVSDEKLSEVLRMLVEKKEERRLQVVN